MAEHCDLAVQHVSRKWLNCRFGSAYVIADVIVRLLGQAMQQWQM